MTLPSKAEQKQAKRLVSDPGFQYAMRMHALINLFFSNNPRLRGEMYERAGLREAIEGAEKRVNG